MKSITATELRNKAAEVLEEGSTTGKLVVVTRYGKPLVRIEALHSSRPRLGALSDRTTIVGDIISPIFDEWNDIVSPTKTSKESR